MKILTDTTCASLLRGTADSTLNLFPEAQIINTQQRLNMFIEHMVTQDLEKTFHFE